MCSVSGEPVTTVAPDSTIVVRISVRASNHGRPMPWVSHAPAQTPQAIVDLVRPRADARHVTFHSLEQPYVDQLTLDQLLLPDVLLATGMDGRGLARAHGAPLRLVVPRMYGYKSVKRVGRIEFSAQAAPGYWEQRGYDADAWVDGDAPA